MRDALFNEVVESVKEGGQAMRDIKEWLEHYAYRYRGRWIAMKDGKLLASDSSREELLKRIPNKKGVILFKIEENKDDKR